jgi:type VI secretion system VasD/TssJ family lipoprotein
MLRLSLPLVVLATAALLAGCRAPAAPATTVVITGTQALNAGGNAAIVRLYPLASDARFRQTPQSDFWRAGSAVDADLAGAVREVLLYPGDEETIELALGGAAYLGVAADLRAPERDGWRAVFPVGAVDKQTLAVTVDEASLAVDIGD